MLLIAFTGCAAQRPASTYSRAPDTECAIEPGQPSTIVVPDRSSRAAPSTQLIAQVTPDPENGSFLTDDMRVATQPVPGGPDEHPMNRFAVFWVARVSASPERVACVRADRVLRSMPPSTALVLRFSGAADEVIRDAIEVDWDSLRDGRPYGTQWELHRGTAFVLHARDRSVGAGELDRYLVSGRPTARWSGNSEGAITFCPRIVLASGDWRIALDRWFWTLDSCERAIAR